MEFKDSNTKKEARQARYAEFIGLLRLPFYSKSQSRRLSRLITLRKRDNRIAFNEEKHNEK